MRDIKFRALSEGKIHQCLGISLNNNTAALIEVEGMFNASWCKVEKYLQYTGLKDCKGKEIYEGDIVEVRIDGMGTGHKHPVVWDNDDATYKFGHAMLGGSDVEVIGNIYENPELESE